MIIVQETQIPAQNTVRLLGLDSARGLAILLMVLFHFCYDLSYFHFVSMQFTDPFWIGFRTVTVSLFFIVSGWTMTLSPEKGMRWSRFYRRFGQVAGAAVAISVVTYLMFPQQWIYFGILHFFALSMWIALPFRQRPMLALWVGLLFFLLYATVDSFNLTPLFLLLQPWLNLPNSTLDIARLIPWFGIILFGIFLGHYGKKCFSWIPVNVLSRNMANLYFWKTRQSAVMRPLAWIGKRPLSIYLIHQPILFSVIALVAKITA